ncbi:hypothetical protein FACS1894172_11030 [Spirochaetia bacterium]|nr:hypothetical protein FACS1894172_11030 [Spirochaetia bacterium]
MKINIGIVLLFFFTVINIYPHDIYQNIELYLKENNIPINVNNRNELYLYKELTEENIVNFIYMLGSESIFFNYRDDSEQHLEIMEIAGNIGIKFYELCKNKNYKIPIIIFRNEKSDIFIQVLEYLKYLNAPYKENTNCIYYSDFTDDKMTYKVLDFLILNINTVKDNIANAKNAEENNSNFYIPKIVKLVDGKLEVVEKNYENWIIYDDKKDEYIKYPYISRVGELVDFIIYSRLYEIVMDLYNGMEMPEEYKYIAKENEIFLQDNKI